MLKKWWKYSTVRFYVLNTIHNYDFWLNSQKIFETKEYLKPATMSFRNNKYDKIVKKRFVGYKYKNKIYLDNPGLSIVERDVWEEWKTRGLI